MLQPIPDSYGITWHSSSYGTTDDGYTIKIWQGDASRKFHATITNPNTEFHATTYGGSTPQDAQNSARNKLYEARAARRRAYGPPDIPPLPPHAVKIA